MEQRIDQTIAIFALDHAPAGILVLDKQQTILFINAAAARITRQAPGDLVGKSWQQLPESLRTGLAKPEGTVEVKDAKGAVSTIRCTRHNAALEAISVHYLVDVTDQQEIIQERDRLTGELSRLTTRDSLTSLPNQKAMWQALEPLISRSRRYENPLSVVRLRFEDAAPLNARYGEDAHSATMIKMAQTLRDQIRWADMIGRFDDSEFLLVLPETSAEAASTLVEKLAGKLADTQVTSGQGTRFIPKARFGVASWQKGDDARLLVNRAGAGI